MSRIETIITTVAIVGVVAIKIAHGLRFNKLRNEYFKRVEDYMAFADKAIKAEPNHYRKIEMINARSSFRLSLEGTKYNLATKGDDIAYVTMLLNTLPAIEAVPA